MTEKEMMEMKIPFFDTWDKVEKFVKSLESEANEYGKAAYCASLAATAVFNYVCHREGLTGFQASCADLDILRRTRHIEGSFIILNAKDMLYPQYNLQEKLEKWMREQKTWLSEESKKLLKDEANQNAHPDVVKHWQKLAK